MPSILLLNGPNLNLLGSREPEIYGTATLATIVSDLEQTATQNDVMFSAFQSNAEHELIGKVQQAASDKTSFIIINPAAFTHTSVAMRDAFQATGTPFIEIHISNIYQREEFRKKSYFSDLAHGVIAGFGVLGYHLAMQAALKHLEN
ncbi:3-dehydroquinate dehydratase II [hydrothermal vent metagenome]|uniref:3-dehydroquinate dehydratase n=1 Tax=hydrothermal vent metagenome TaxID=652676 RepID=A0A3B0Z6E0_9ZZZZ